MADYIHLNPVRVGLAGGMNGKLVGYEWSSLPGYQRGKGPPWLVLDRVMAAFASAQDGRGRRAYVDFLEKRAEDNGGNLSEASMAALRGGWYLGDETLRDQLLGLVKKGSKLLSKKGSHATAPVKCHGEGEAERMVVRGLEELGLANDAGELIQARKGDPRKIALASVVRDRTSVSNKWLAHRLAMGHSRSVSCLIRQGNENSQIRKLCSKLRKMLPCEDPNEDPNEPYDARGETAW